MKMITSILFLFLATTPRVDTRTTVSSSSLLEKGDLSRRLKEARPNGPQSSASAGMIEKPDLLQPVTTSHHGRFLSVLQEDCFCDDQDNNEQAGDDFYFWPCDCTFQIDGPDGRQQSAQSHLVCHQALDSERNECSCDISIVGNKCNSCSPCLDDTMEYDCSNVLSWEKFKCAKVNCFGDCLHEANETRTSDPLDDDDGGVSVAGIVVSSVLAALAVTIIIYCLVRRPQRIKDEDCWEEGADVVKSDVVGGDAGDPEQPVVGHGDRDVGKPVQSFDLKYPDRERPVPG